MRDPDAFDAFYAETRGRLLLQTYAAIGDLPAARAAVRDAYVAAWHHWRKVARQGDAEGWVRSLAWSNGQRRHRARLWHREKGLDPDAAAALEALADLPGVQRRLLLLTELGGLSVEQAAREVGLPPGPAAQQLALATSRLAAGRGVPDHAFASLWEGLARVVDDERWQRASIVRRAGARRRRTHTLVGVAATVGALLATGTLVSDDAGVRPSLHADDAVAERPGPDPQQPAEPEELLHDDALLDDRAVAGVLAGRGWTVADTHANTEGDGLVVPCQQQRYADPRGTAALFRSFESRAGQGRRATTAFQAAEASRSPARARRAYRTALGWFGGCREGRPQLLASWEAAGVGDTASVLALRDWAGPATLLVGVARSGGLVTTVGVRVPGPDAPTDTAAARPVLRLLASAVDGICELPDGDACAADARLRTAEPPPTGQVPAMLSEVDLPPVGVPQPWVGSEPRRATDNAAATGCDTASFSGSFAGARWSRNLTRTFVFPESDLPAAFGLTQTVGALPRERAGEFVRTIRGRMAACAEDNLGTEVRQLRETTTGPLDVSVWEVTTEISDQASVRYLMALVRRGTALAQVGFVPAEGAAMSDPQFLALVDRAAARVGRLPAPQQR